jgi:hypothetical protein
MEINSVIEVTIIISSVPVEARTFRERLLVLACLEPNENTKPSCSLSHPIAFEALNGAQDLVTGGEIKRFVQRVQANSASKTKQSEDHSL